MTPDQKAKLLLLYPDISETYIEQYEMGNIEDIHEFMQMSPTEKLASSITFESDSDSPIQALPRWAVEVFKEFDI